MQRIDLLIYQGDDFGTQVRIFRPVERLPFPPHPPYWPWWPYWPQGYWPYWPAWPRPLHPLRFLHQVPGPCENIPQDLTGWKAGAQLRRRVADRAPDIAAEMEIQWTDPQHGRFVIFLDHTITQSLRGQYTWDLQMVKPPDAANPNEFHQTVMGGCVHVTQDVTRATGAGWSQQSAGLTAVV